MYKQLFATWNPFAVSIWSVDYYYGIQAKAFIYKQKIIKQAKKLSY